MKELRYTLVSDGPSERMLLPILTWLLRKCGVMCPIQREWVDFREIRNPPKKLADRMILALDLYPCDVLFVHRDAEKESYEVRKQEILNAIQMAKSKTKLPDVVCVVPVRMQEAWLLFDVEAIRKAAGNPNGKNPLTLPSLSKLEDRPDPKADLYELLGKASGLSGRRLKKLNVASLAYRVTDVIEDFSPLNTLSAFQKLSAEMAKLIEQKGCSYRQR